MVADDSDSWVLIDDTEPEEPQPSSAAGSWATSTSWGAPSTPTANAQEADEAPPKAQSAGTQEAEAPQAQGWDSFSSANTWNNMRAATPGGASGWGVPEADTAEHNPTQEAAQTQWFTADDLGDDFPDDAFADGEGGAPAEKGFGALRSRLSLPSGSGMSFGPGFVTLTVTLVGVLLVVSSIVWHPHVP